MALGWTLDLTYGSHGYAASASLGASLNASLWSFGFAPDGRVIAAGSYQANSIDLLVARSLPDGALDTTFNNTGYALVPAYNTPLIYGVSAGPDGSVDVASSLVQNALGMEVVRLKAQGALDGNFAGGIDHVSVAGPDDARFMRAWELPDREVVATGWVDNAGDNVTRALVARYEPDGSRDPSFGVDGIVEFPSYGADHPEVVLPLPDGQFLLAGVRVVGPTQPQELMLMRVNADGSLDTTFGSGGITADQVSGGYSEQVTDLTLDPAGNIVIIGLSTSYYGVSSTMIARYLPGGAPDSSFGTNGSTTVLPESYPRENWPQRVGVAASGDIVVIDTLNWGASAPITSDFGVLRLLPTGTLDSNFGSGGLVSTDFGGKNDFPQALLLNPDGTIVVAGAVNVVPGGAPSLEGDYGIIRYLPSGAPDPSFGSGGAVIGMVDNTASGVLNLTSQSNGAILAGGTVWRQPFQMRLNPDGSLDPTFGNGGLVVADSTAGDSVPWYIPPGDVLGLSSGQMAAVGQTLSGVVGQDGVASATIARYLTAPGPVAVLGRNYAIPADGSITLSAGNSFDNDGTIASYEWDLNYNGVSFNTDATGISAVASDAGLTADETKTVALRVTDNLGYTDLTTATLTVVPSDVINAPTGSPTIVLAAGDDTQHVRWSMGGTSGQVAVQDPNGLTIDGGPATISFDYTGGNPLPAILHLNGTFTIDGFQSLRGTTLDLGRSTLFVNYAGSSDPLPLIQRYLQTGYNGGAWNGSGGAGGGAITTSAGSSLFGIGYADAADSIGTNPVANTIELKFTVAGDTNLDGTVNLADFSTLVRHFGQAAGWDAGDLNYEGTTNLADLLMLVRHFGKSLPPTLSASDLSSPAEEAARRRLAIRRA